MARKKKRKKNKVKVFNAKFFVYFFLLLSLSTFIFFCGYKIYTSEVFKIRADTIRADFEIRKGLIEKVEGELIFKLDLESIYLYVKREYPEYRNIVVIKRFPNTLEIRAEKRKPLAQVGSRRFYLVDKEGIVISGASDRQFRDFPFVADIIKNSHLNVGDNLYTSKLETAFKVIQLAEEEEVLKKINSLNEDYRFRLSFLHVSSPQAVYFYLTDENRPDNPVEVIMNKEEVREKIKLLAQIIEQKINNKMSLIRYIDFRFQKVYIDYRR